MPDLPAARIARRDFLRFASAAGAATAFAGSLSACSGPSSTTGADLDTIEAGISYGLSTTFDPMEASGATPVAANMHIFEGIVDLDPVTFKANPALGDAMPEKVDDTTYRVGLREGARFHDGSNVTSDDVVFSFQRCLEEDSSMMKQFLPFLDEVKAIDESTVEFTLKYPFELFPTRVSVVKIVPKKLVTKDAKAFGSKPVGTGPYKLVKAAKNDKITFKSFDDYNGDRPAKAKNMVWRLTSDPAARVSAMTSGQVQAIEDVPYIDVKRLSKEAKAESVQSFGLLFLMFNCEKEPYNDKRVRQALHYALDFDKIVDNAMVGNGTAATSFLQKTHPDYMPAERAYTYDPDKARDLLKKAGVDKLDVTLKTTDDQWVLDIAPVIKESWDAIGVSTTLDGGESSSQYKQVADGDFEAMAAPGDPSVFGNDVDLLMRWWYAGTWPNDWYRWSGKEYDKLSDLLDAAAETSDAAKRKEKWQQAINLVAEEAPLYPVVHRKLPTAWDDSKLTGFRPLPTTGVSFLDVGRA